MSETTLVASLLHELSVELGFELTLEREFGYAGRIQTKHGKVLYFRGTHFDINPLGASEIATDKAYASYFMNKLGFPTPEGKSFYSDRWCKKIKSDQDTSAALRYARTLQYPVIVKPNSKSQGQGVVKAFTDDELTDALDYIFNTIGDPVALVQRVVQGSDYRIVVLGTEVLCAYRRTPLSVQGDGGSTIQQLLRKKQEAFIQKGRDTTIYVGDPRTKNILKRMGLSLKSVIAEGNAIQLLDNANLSSGGEGDDVTHILHSDYQQSAIKLVRDMGLTFCGVDIMTPNPIDKMVNKYCVIELNAAPGLDYYAEGGEVQKGVVKNLYRKMLTHMIRA